MTSHYLSCDWGTTHFRLRLVDSTSGGPVAGVQSDQGVARLAAEAQPGDRPERFRSVLAAALERLRQESGLDVDSAPIAVSGMASATIGWHELPYASTPWRLDGLDLICHELTPIETATGRHRVILISGARTASDVLRGEESQAVGLFTLPQAARVAERATVILPGTHSKHLYVEQGRVVDFRTFMTGELFEALSRNTILRHSVGDEPVATDPISSEATQALRVGVRGACELPFSAALFRVRTRQVLDGHSSAANRAYLSGLILGNELSYLAGHDLENVPLILAAGAALAPAYQVAMDELGLGGRLTAIAPADVERLTALGQGRVLKRLNLK
jgi:2-dehydro-3-deoxygalactonokinase